MNNPTRGVFYILFAMTLMACSKGPSSDTVERALQQYAIDNSLGGVFISKNITKTNGYILNDIYNLEISFQIHFLVDVNDFIPGAREMLGGHLNSKNTKPEEIIGNAFSIMKYAGFIEEFGLFSKGDVRQYNDVIKFIDTENGWKVYGT